MIESGGGGIISTVLHIQRIQISERYHCTRSGPAESLTLYIITSIKNNYKKFKGSRDGVPKSIQTRVVRMVTKFKGRPYFCGPGS